MGYPSTVDSGGVPPVLIGSDVPALTGAIANTLVANTVYLFAFEIQSQATVTGGKWRSGNTAAGTTNMGIYLLGGALIAGSDSGAISNAANITVSFTYANPILLAPGQYFMALAPSSSTDQYLSKLLLATLSETRFRLAANAMSAGALPSTTGVPSSAASATYPTCSLTVQGGI